MNQSSDSFLRVVSPLDSTFIGRYTYWNTRGRRLKIGRVLTQSVTEVSIERTVLRFVKCFFKNLQKTTVAVKLNKWIWYTSITPQANVTMSKLLQCLSNNFTYIKTAKYIILDLSIISSRLPTLSWNTDPEYFKIISDCGTKEIFVLCYCKDNETSCLER